MGKKTESNEQAKKFQQAAKELGCDESEENFDKALESISTGREKVEKSQLDTNDDFSTPYQDGEPFTSSSSAIQSHSESNQTKQPRQ